MSEATVSHLSAPKVSRYLFKDTRLAIVWLVVRIYVGWAWLEAGWEKVHSPAWTGDQAGAALQGFVAGALKKTIGDHPDVSAWYAYFLDHFVAHHTVLFSYLVAYGEVAVGIALILGIFTGIAAFFGAFMNFNYLFAGTVSINPLLALLEVFLILAWRTAGWLGADRFLLRKVGAFRHSR